MTTDAFVPQDGYRDLRFGMTRADVQTILGKPLRSSPLADRPEIHPDDMVIVKDAIAYDYAPYTPFHKREISLTFYKDRLVKIFVDDSVGPLMFRGIDLFGNNRKAVMDALFGMDSALYGKRECGFWGKLGIVAAWPSFWKQYKMGYVEFVDSEFVLDLLDFYFFDNLDKTLK